ncbi:putative hydrolase YxeP [Candidatus Izimaplasma bacterium HR1]|jgi:amidohydrolase|uniref:M20 metallopeptidase family protein n=1 Tax=Candidatus Izimoplasma sp. HR1 TaxID=1541959 RepID=UPI0004F7045C|nr:putative hydrolase YxeP [Candidatus Izimaplasma bacterium HR1]
MVKLEDIKNYEAYLIEKRRDFHMHPETGFEEFRTSQVIAEELRELGFKLITGVGVTGIIGTLEGPIKGKTVLLRADIDALSMQEENDVPYKSLNDGKMHSCGHDTHTAMLLGACKFFSENKDLLEGKLKVVFQSAEEGPTPGGGISVVQEGHLDDVDGVFALHITTKYESGKFKIKPGPAMAAPDEFRIRINGFGTHASAPETGSDVILTAAELITKIQTITSRNTKAVDSVVISVCTINGGTSFNILPDHVDLRGTIRTLNKETRQFVFKRLDEIVNAVSKLNNCKGELEIIEAYPPLINDVNETMFIVGLAKDLIGAKNVEVLTEPSMGGEDFSYYLEKRPGAYGWLGGRAKNQKEVYFNHNPKFDIDESSLLIGMGMHINTAIEFLKK